MKSINLTVIAKPEVASNQAIYVGQCREYDICVQGKTLSELRERFKETIIGHVAISRALGVEPFKSLPKGLTIDLPPGQPVHSKDSLDEASINLIPV